jgi:GNAT superfamily N-acetyltransferase
MTQNRTTIRPAVRADVGAIAELANALNRFHKNPDDLYSARLIEAEAFDGTPLISVLVAERDGALVGYAFFQDVFNAETAQRGVWLDDLFVREPARRQGIGQDLLAAVARETLARGGKALWWSVFRNNRSARTFYAKLGARDNDADVVELELDGEALTGLAQAARE